MKQTIDYNIDNFPSEEARQEQAIKDLENWLTKKTFDKVVAECEGKTSTYSQMAFYFGLAGVQGYPVKAFCDKYVDIVSDEEYRKLFTV